MSGAGTSNTISSGVAIDPAQNPLGPMNSASDQRFRARTGSRIVLVFRVLQMPRNDYGSRDQEHTFATLVHESIIPFSPFVRLMEGYDCSIILGPTARSRPNRVIKSHDAKDTDAVCSQSTPEGTHTTLG